MGWLQGILKLLVEELEKVLEFILMPSDGYWWQDSKLWFGVMIWGFIWGMWLSAEFEKRYEVVGMYWTTALMALGLNLAALSLLQTLGSFGFLGVLLMTGSNVRFTKKLFPGKAFQAPTPGSENVLTATNMYENVSGDFLQICVIFAGQTMLFGFVVYCSFVKYDGSEDATYGFWVIAYVAVQMSGFFKRGKDSQLGQPWNLEQFQGLIHINPQVEYLGKSWDVIPCWQIALRHRMGFLVHTLYRDIIAFVTPILLMQSDSAMEFVQNCFALSYITRLDCLGDPKEIRIRNRG